MDNGKFAQGLVGAEGMTEGLYEFDPLGFSSEYTYLVPYFREAELKHGRIAMLAWVGMVVPDFVRIPGERYSFEAVPLSIQAHEAFSSATGVNLVLSLKSHIEVRNQPDLRRSELKSCRRYCAEQAPLYELLHHREPNSTSRSLIKSL